MHLRRGTNCELWPIYFIIIIKTNFCELSYCVDFNDVRCGVDEPFLSVVAFHENLGYGIILAIHTTTFLSYKPTYIIAKHSALLNTIHRERH